MAQTDASGLRTVLLDSLRVALGDTAWAALLNPLADGASIVVDPEMGEREALGDGTGPRDTQTVGDGSTPAVHEGEATTAVVPYVPPVTADLDALRDLLERLARPLALSAADVSAAVVTAVGGGGVAVVYERHRWALRTRGADAGSVHDNPFVDAFPLTATAYRDSVIRNGLDYVLVGRGQWAPDRTASRQPEDPLVALQSEYTAAGGWTAAHRADYNAGLQRALKGANPVRMVTQVQANSRPGGLIQLLRQFIFDRDAFRVQYETGEFTPGQRSVIYLFMLQLGFQFAVYGQPDLLTPEEIRLMWVMQCLPSPAFVTVLVQQIRDRLGH